MLYGRNDHAKVQLLLDMILTRSRKYYKLLKHKIYVNLGIDPIRLRNYLK